MVTPLGTGSDRRGDRRNDWRAEALQQKLGHELPGLRVQVLASVDSTSTRLLEQCSVHPEPQFAPVLLVAENQTGGRGRHGRTWHSARGASLTFSLALPLQSANGGLSLAVGVALAEALDEPGAATPRLMLKWPNDLWLLDAPDVACKIGHPFAGPTERNPGRKLGGVLIETVSRGAQRIGVIGIGLNVLPLAVQDASNGVASLQEIHPQLSASQALHRVALPLVRALRRFERDGFVAFEERFRARDLLFGRDVVAGALHGVAHGVASNGALRLRCGQGPNAQLHQIVSGEVSVRLSPHVQAKAHSGHAAAAPLAPC